MKCPFCESFNTKVIDTRSSEDGKAIRRRRECIDCKKRFTTYERYDYNSIIVVKKSGARESFDRNKVLKGMQKSCEKRKVSREVLDKAVSEIELAINHLNAKEIKSSEIGEMIMEKLKDIDQVAYVRFASVYKEFKDVESFKETIEDIHKK